MQIGRFATNAHKGLSYIQNRGYVGTHLCVHPPRQLHDLVESNPDRNNVIQ